MTRYSVTGLPDDLITPGDFGRRQLRILQYYAGQRIAVADTHTRIHSGEIFASGAILASLNNDANFNVSVTTAAGDFPHFIVNPVSDGSSDFEVYEGATVSEGTLMTPTNRKRYSTRQQGSALRKSPTIASVGTKIFETHIAGATGPMGGAGSASDDFAAEWILDEGKTYLFRLINRAGQARRVGMNFLWYPARRLPDNGQAGG
jgi:hypothetical protein